MRHSIALLILVCGSLLTFAAGCGGPKENVVLENPPMSAEVNQEEENASVGGES